MNEELDLPSIDGLTREEVGVLANDYVGKKRQELNPFRHQALWVISESLKLAWAALTLDDLTATPDERLHATMIVEDHKIRTLLEAGRPPRKSEARAILVGADGQQVTDFSFMRPKRLFPAS